MLPFESRVDLGTRTLKGHSTFHKAPALLELRHQIVYCHIYKALAGGGVLPPAAMQLEYSTASPADWAIGHSLQRCNGCILQPHPQLTRYCVCHFKCSSPRRWLRLGRRYLWKIWHLFFNSFQPDVKRITRRLEDINYEIDRSKVSVFNRR